MDRGENPSAAICKLCGEAFTLPEDEIPGNLPRVLLCGHIYCTVCLRSLESDSAIRCPECEVESTLPEGGVYGLQEESRIIGLIYTTKMNKMKSLRCEKSKNRRKNKLSPSADTLVKTEDTDQPADIEKNEKSVDEALAKAAESLAQLVHIHETLKTGLAEQVKKEVARLEVEIKQAADKAFHAIQKWKDTQSSQLTKLTETDFSASQAAVCRVQEQIKALEIAVQMAREVRRVPFLEKYCILDKVLETLKAPVDNQSFDMTCISMGTGKSCVFQCECLNGNLALSLKMEVGDPKELAQSPPQSYHPGSFNRKSHWKRADERNTGCILRSDKLPSPQKEGQQRAKANSPSSRGSSPSPKPRRGLSRYSSASDLVSPDVIIEEFLDEGQEQVLPPTGPELAGDKLRLNRRRKHEFSPNKRNVTQWVVVTHIVNPSHFYIRYVAEKKESEMVSHKINKLCSGDGCSFTVKDTVDTDSLIFVKSKEGLWCRARVVEVFQKGSLDPMKACAVTQMAKTRVFFLDHGFTKTITIKSEDVDTETSLNAVNNQLRKVDTAIKVILFDFAPMAIRCSFKDLVPYDVTKGWSKEAQVEFRSVVGSAAVEMRILGQDRDFLLVDLRKAPMEQSSDVFISVREYLVFIEVARLYSPVALGSRPLQYYPPVYPKVNRELGAVVSHISNPADFHIHLADNMEFMLLSTKLQEFYSDLALLGEDKLSIYCPVIGQACIARFDDGRWCRAQVIGHPGGRKVEVRYVDFGDRRILSVRDLRRIKDEFFALPARAIHCCLSDVIPVEGQSWSDACTNRFISLAKDKLVTIIATGRVPKSDPLPVKLFQGEGNEPLTNIAELLVKEELAHFKEGLNSNNAMSSGNDAAIWDPPLELGSATGGADTPEHIISGDQNEEPLEFQAQMKLPAQLKDLKVRVSHTNSPSSFYVQLTQYDAHLKRICELVKQECAQTEPQDVAWKADMYCAALFNGVWERAQICSDVTSNNTAEVRLCDHGNTVKIHVNYLRPLPSSLIGSLALECTLNEIRPTGGRSTWTDTACDSFCYYLTGASAVMTIKEMTDERPIPVTLFCSNRMGEFVSIANFLVSEGLALRERKPRDAVVQQSKDIDPQSPLREIQTESETKTSCPPVPIVSFPPLSSIVSGCMPPKPAPRSIMAAEKVKTSMYQPPELPCLGHIQINVSAIGDDGLIYFRTQNAENQLEQLRERIQQSMKALPRQKPYTWKSVLGCAVIGPDMLWYRGQLLEVLGGHVKVQYIDYGLVENIPVVHVYPILLCDDVPQLCVTCQLLGINPVGGKWQRDAVALMRELLLNRCVDMNVVELPADPRGPLTIELFLDGLSLSRILCQHEHASMDRTVSPLKGLSVMSSASVLDDWDINTKGLKGLEELMLGSFTYPNLPQEGEHFKVKVKHLLTPNELFLWPLEETADVEVNGETLEEALTRINTNIGSLARLSSFPRGGPCLAEYSDEKYYRARMVKFISVEPVMLLVHHVDFGSDDILPTSKLRQMPAELLQFPCRALKVKVAGFRAPSVTREENVLPYSPKWSLKAAMDMIDLLHTNITASVVAQEPELTVLLYNEDGELVHLPLVSRGLAELE